MRMLIEVEPAVARLFPEDGPGRLRARRLAQCLERYELILERAGAPAFAAAEWELLLEAHAGTVAEPASAVDEFALIIEEAAEAWELGRAHGIDACALGARLHGLDVSQSVALVEQRERDRRRAARDEAEREVVAFPRG